MASASWGSSPRVRGTREAAGEHVGLAGIIPACAGNTHGNARMARPLWDHPRVCGEHEEDEYLIMRELGSSPRVRGTHLVAQAFNGGFGIIPACAGNTS